MNLEELIELRHELHQYPEPGFEEWETGKRIRAFMIKHGAEESNFKTFAKTGMTYDITGTRDDSSAKMTIALRTDIDALRMDEWNEHLSYRSKKDGLAHMCGHDGHMTCLLGTARLLLLNRGNMSKNHTVRLLFQPAEEGPGGAEPMVKEGCLEGVDEVYGFHNAPYPLGQIQVRVGAVMSEVTCLEFRLRKNESHDSKVSNENRLITAGSELVNQLNNLVALERHCNDTLVLTINAFKGGETFDSPPEEVWLRGTMRTFNSGTTKSMKKKLQSVLDGISVGYNCDTSTSEMITMYPAVINWKEQASHVTRVAKLYLGEENVKEDQMPHMASEDFSFFIQEKPGAFFFWGTNEDGTGLPNLHCPDNDFNDKVIPMAVEFYILLLEDRFGTKIWQKEA